MKKNIIDIEAHALFRMLERGAEFGLNYYETKKRAFVTVRSGNKAKRRHLSGKNKTYYLYFKENGRKKVYKLWNTNEKDICPT